MQAGQCNCYRVSCTVFLIVGEYSCLCVATVYVWLLFIVSFRTIKERKNKFVSYYLFTMCKFQLITTIKTWKKWQTPQDVYNKDADQTVPPHNPMPVFIQPGMFYLFWHANSWLQNISLIVFNHLRPPYTSGDKWELTQIFDLINCR